jgi:hypothetical protein
MDSIRNIRLADNGDGTFSLGGGGGPATIEDPITGEVLNVIDPGTAGQNSALVAGGYHTLTQSTAVIAALAAIDCANFAWISVQVTSIGTSGSALFQGSNDGVTWTSVWLTRTVGGYDTATATGNAVGIYHGPIPARYFRLNMTALAAGTYSVVITLSALPRQILSFGVSANLVQVGNISIQSPGDAKGINTLLGTAVHVYNGTSLDVTRSVNTLKTGQSTALASGSALALWTPTAGKKFRLRTLRGRASVAGRYEVRDGAVTVIGYIYLDANRWVTVMDMEANGYLSTTTNNVLNIYNQSGSAADLDFICSGNEE